VPDNSKALVAILKTRLFEAVELGKASDAKTFLDVIERLAKMSWLDETTPQERLTSDHTRHINELIDLDQAAARFFAEYKDENDL
jgi:hypothetical protein